MSAEIALQKLQAYLERNGGSIALVAGWTARVGVRASPAGKATDSYWYDENGLKFRSLVEVGEHFGLVEVKAGRSQNLRGKLDPIAVDKKLWPGASEQGWVVTATADCHSTYTAPDGKRFRSIREAEAHLEAHKPQPPAKAESESDDVEDE